MKNKEDNPGLQGGDAKEVINRKKGNPVTFL